jgi:hypothetical protein
MSTTTDTQIISSLLCKKDSQYSFSPTCCGSLMVQLKSICNPEVVSSTTAHNVTASNLHVSVHSDRSFVKRLEPCMYFGYDLKMQSSCVAAGVCKRTSNALTCAKVQSPAKSLSGQRILIELVRRCSISTIVVDQSLENYEILTKF